MYVTGSEATCITHVYEAQSRNVGSYTPDVLSPSLDPCSLLVQLVLTLLVDSHAD